ncbi:hypothetical protein [Clostridium estertheticum]|uniref:hypothetical protein n=1 Tax=Clostridium estertheticum TaxID=238834 RepID=UPI001C0D16AF|nr:hypothetical protein [Clostridium estertheticum]MBU3171091.1 hypothetical protein [Clostridium estertheticum]
MNTKLRDLQLSDKEYFIFIGDKSLLIELITDFIIDNITKIIIDGVFISINYSEI